MKHSKHTFSALLLVFTMALMAGCETMGLDNAFGSNETSQGEVGDEMITTLVNDAFASDTLLANNDINVETRDGEVYLSGTVDSNSEYEEAEELAMDIDGVEDVHNNLRVM